MLARFARAAGDLYYQATRRTEAEQFAGLSAAVGAHYGEDLFGYVADRAGGGPALLLDPSGRLVDIAPHALDEFLGETAVLYSVVSAIATGVRTWSGITRRVGRSGGALLRPLQ